MRLSNQSIVIILLALIVMMRVPYIGNSPYEAGDAWRQSDTESMARNFAEDRFNIFFPQLNYDGPAPNYAQLEFQITTFLIALLYRMFGYHYELARLIPILFFTGSACYLYLISRKFYSAGTAWIITLLYALFPLNLYYSRAIMPESAAIFFSIGAFYYFNQWIVNEKTKLLIVAAFMTALAILVKVPAVFIGIPMLWMSIVKYRREIFVKWQLWFFAGVSLSLPFIYFKWLEKTAEFTFVTGIGSKHILPKFATAMFTEEALQFFAVHLPQSFTWVGLALAVIGLFSLKWRSEYPIIVWFIAMAAEAVTIVAVIKFSYYLLFIGPLLAILAGKTLGSMLKYRYGVISVVLLISAMAFHSIAITQPKFVENEMVLKQAEYVKKYTSKEDLIVVGTLSPELINASERKGWRANIHYYEEIPEGPEAELSYFISQGAKYFIPLKGSIYGDQDHSYRKYLDENFTQIQVQEDRSYSFYRLAEN